MEKRESEGTGEDSWRALIAVSLYLGCELFRDP